MKVKFLKSMTCPYCREGIRSKDVIEGNDEEVITGIVTCACNSYPVVAGFLSLKRSHLNGCIVRMLKWRMEDRAVGIVFFKTIHRFRSVNMFGSLSKVLLLIVEPEAQGAYHKFDTRNSSFYDQEDLEGSLNYQVYLKHRFSAESFWSLYPFLRLLRENAEWVLDLGCGVGHASFVISTCVRPNRLLCADSNLKNLIMLKRFFVSKAECIRIDANYPLPFRDKIFSSVLMLDSFHYVRSQALLAGELERILGAQGILLILHLHNSLGKNVSAGYSLPPKTMADLFRGTAVKIFPEDDLLEQFLKEGLLDLSKTYSEADLNLSNVVALVASNSKDAFRRYLDVADEFMQCRSNLVINPIYEVKVVKNRLIMERHFPSEFFRREYPMTERYLPESCVVERELADDVKERRKLGPQWASPDHFSRTRELMMKFVIINVPEKYI